MTKEVTSKLNIEILIVSKNSGECRIPYWTTTSKGMILKVAREMERLHYGEDDTVAFSILVNKDCYSSEIFKTLDEVKTIIRKIYEVEARRKGAVNG